MAAAAKGTIDVGATLATARAALDEGDLDRALVALLAAWRAVPDAKLAAAIEEVGARVGVAIPRPRGDRAWHALARRGNPSAHAALREMLLHTALRHARFPIWNAHTDPRTAMAIVDFLADMTGVTGKSFAVWRPVFVELARTGDPRVLRHLPRIRKAWMHAPLAVVAQVERLLAAAAAAYPAPTPRLDQVNAAAVKAIRAHPSLTGAKDERHLEAALLAAVYADPADDGPRSVYADWLQERSDPRGDLIARQLKSERETNRTIELLHDHALAWLGSLGAHRAEYTDAEFRRGFPAEIVLAHGGTFAPDPAWATIEIVERGLPASDANAMPELWHATDLAQADIVRLAALASPPPLQVLGATVDPANGGLRRALARLRLPELHTLELRTTRAAAFVPRDLAMLFAIGPLAHLTLPARIADLPAWLAAVTPSALATLAFAVSGTRSSLALARDRKGAFTHLALVERDGPLIAEPQILAVCDALETAPAGSIARLAIEMLPRLTSRARRRLDAAIARHAGIRVFHADS